MPPKKSTTPSTEVEKTANKGIGEVINYFYVTYKRTRPDATHYKQNYNIIKNLMFPSEEYRTYTAGELKGVIDELILNKITMLSLTILSYPDLCRSIVDNDQQSLKIIIRNLKLSQAKDGIYAEDIKTSKGW